ncbi:putative transcription factor C2H2 family [Helianthus anomalus]
MVKVCLLEVVSGGEKRVFVCPEPSCLHHDPCHALGDLVGIKKHYRRKHSDDKQWVCEKCSKGYAVQSDYKAHLKTCGTRDHSCDCGRVFSRMMMEKQIRILKWMMVVVEVEDGGDRWLLISNIYISIWL